MDSINNQRVFCMEIQWFQVKPSEKKWRQGWQKQCICWRLSLLVYDAMLIGKYLPKIQKRLFPISSVSMQTKRSQLEQHNPKDGSSKFLQNVSSITNQQCIIGQKTYNQNQPKNLKSHNLHVWYLINVKIQDQRHSTQWWKCLVLKSSLTHIASSCLCMHFSKPPCPPISKYCWLVSSVHSNLYSVGVSTSLFFSFFNNKFKWSIRQFTTNLPFFENALCPPLLASIK